MSILNTLSNLGIPATLYGNDPTNEDEYLFESSIKESWRDFDDDQTGLVLASPYSLDDDLEIDADLLVEILAHEDNRRPVFEDSAAPIRANSSFWVD